MRVSIGPSDSARSLVGQLGQVATKRSGLINVPKRSVPETECSSFGREQLERAGRIGPRWKIDSRHDDGALIYPPLRESLRDKWF